jgi:ATP-binding cassette subfamily B protein
MVLLMTGLLFVESIIQYVNVMLTNTLGQNVIMDMRTQLYKHIVHFRLKYFDNNAIGTLITRTISDIQTIADVFSQGFLEILGDILKLIVITVVMFSNDWRLSLVSLSTIPVLLIATYIFKNAIKTSFQDVRTQVARLNAFVQEHITGMSIVQLFSREKEEYSQFQQINEKHKVANIQSIWHYSVFFPVVEILSAISIGLLVWWGSKEILHHTFTVGKIVAFIMYINLLFRPIRQLADRFNTLQMGMVSSERVFAIIDTDNSIVNEGTLSAEKINGEIEFKNVWFAYKKDEWVLKDISFKINQSKTLALVGATGSGKSTIVSLINRFYEYDKGEILIDGINIRDYELGSLRRSIGLVLQDVFLFSDSIMNNITLNNKHISEEEVKQATRDIGANSFIDKLPDGFNYNVMERGAMLSVGQRQLISFIRAFVYKPRIFMLDEATSSIDTESELLIQKATDTLTKQCTSIVVAHRLTTIQKADTILVIENGMIIESGNHSELLGKNGAYKKLYELQFDKV